MKASALTPMIVVDADQVHSRSAPDAVPDALAALHVLDTRLPFERTAGDEIQGLLGDPPGLVTVVQVLTRQSQWRIGIGIGSVEQPLPASTRSARGGAYLAARDAIGAAQHSPTGLALRLDPALRDATAKSVGGLPYGEFQRVGEDIEGVLWMMRRLLQRRTEPGWQVNDLLDAGLTRQQTADQLGISESAVSQRAIGSARAELTRASVVVERLLARLLASLQAGSGALR